MRSSKGSLASAFLSFSLIIFTTHATDQVPLSNELEPIAEMPPIGFGTWNLAKSNASDVVAAAFAAGYRHIDCAAIYGNEKEVGEGIKRGMKNEGLKREEFWVTSKLWNNMHDPKDVPAALNKTLDDLGLSYVGLYLMHWPVASTTLDNGTRKNEISYIPTWQAMTRLTTPSTSSPIPPALRIGVSNFSPIELTTLLPIAKPYAHQYETHPYLPQAGFLEVHKKTGIKVTAYSPLGNSNPTYTSWTSSLSPSEVEGLPPLLQNPVMKAIAEKRGCTTAQVALKWGMVRGTAVIPKSAHEGRIVENWESLGCGLKDEDFEMLEELPKKRFNNPSKGWDVPLYGGLEDSNVGGAVQDSFDASIAELWAGWTVSHLHGERLSTGLAGGLGRSGSMQGYRMEEPACRESSEIWVSVQSLTYSVTMD